jgi:hypothetical protein
MATKLPIEPISGSVFPTLKGKPGNTLFENPPFHPNILNIGGANTATNPSRTDDFTVGTSKSFRRGVIVAGAGVNQSWGGNITFRINFLYNPSTITERRGVDINSGVLPAWARDPNNPGHYNVPLQTQINFSLLFDRTYELWDKRYSQTLAGVFGVRVDVEAFYNLCGINTVETTTTSPHGIVPAPLQSSGALSTVSQGPMQLVPARVYFGKDSIGALSYYGYVSNFDVTWTHFNSYMTPQRAAVNVGFTALPDLYSGGYTGSAANSG